MNLVAINKLQVGMILGENIYRGDQIVISEDVILSSKHINMIGMLREGNVKVKFTKDVEKPNFKIDLAERYKISVKKFRNICYSTAIGHKVIYEDVKELVDPLIEEVNNNPQLATRIWQIEKADFYTFEHSVKVCMLTVLLSKWLNKSGDYISDIGKAGLLHDIGKCNIPNEILNKPDKLTDDEFSVMKTHSSLGYILLSITKELSRDVLKGILHHHEKCDGTGYPSKLTGDEIHEYAKLIAIVDVFDAMTSNRVYRQKMNPFKVLEIIENGDDGALDIDMSDVFVRNIIQFYIGSKVILDSGNIAEIVDVNVNSPSRPVIKIENQLIDLSCNSDINIEELILE